ncbi:MAG: hypothetical protein WD598_12530 [Acidimicrobiia bacterium]
MADDQAWAIRLRMLGIWTFGLGWVATIIVASGADSFRDGLAVVIALGASVSLAAAAIFGVGAYVGRSAHHDL